ncbi:MAG TPA: helix-turn-helix domain-containing protein, partial [Firmicutes bacterium]|nr:helix-turn-helix domain-containing protein [Bacillota bacterium]
MIDVYSQICRNKINNKPYKSERSQIMVLKKENYSNREIAKVLNRAPQTI